mgnify:CR=1 FL=1
MTERYELLAAISFIDAANAGSTPEQLIDAYRAAVLREAADRYTALADQNEAYDREHGDLDETARIQHDAVRDVAAGLRRLADEAQQPTPAPAEETKPEAPAPARPLLWADLLGAAPDITGGACTQCYMDRARDREHDMTPEHAHCRAALDGDHPAPAEETK